MTEVEIRGAGPGDVPEILRMVKALAEHEREPDAVKATEEMYQQALFGPDPVAYALIAEVKGVPQGVALYFFNFSTWTGKPGIYLEDLFVERSARGKGIGQALLARLARIALDRGCARFEWWVHDWNEPAIAFYRRLGAEPMSEYTVQRVHGAALEALAASA